MRFRSAATLTAVLVAALVLPGAAEADNSSNGLGTKFIRSFPGLPGFTTPTQQQIADAAQGMLDPNADTGDNKPPLTSGYTYMGQFLDHDITLDTSPPPTAPVDPTTLTNSRTFAFDLDSVYGGGPTGSPQFYVGNKFALQEPNINGVRDYIRTPTGQAIINEARNDENEVLSQIQVMFMKAHNRLIDEGLSFNDARATLVKGYQEAIRDDFLPHTISESVDPANVRKLDPGTRGTPIEFSVAAYRFGHSQVRKAYVLNETSGKIQVFSATAPDLRGGRDIPAGREIQWGEFFDDIPVTDTDGNPINVSRKIDTLISSGLFALPIPGAEATGSNVLAFRNMSRAGFYALPSGQAVAKRLGLPVIQPDVLALGPGFEDGTPLWLYVLAESDRLEGGFRLGPLGSTIVAAGFKAALDNGERVTPGKVKARQLNELRDGDGETDLEDLFVFAGVATR